MKNVIYTLSLFAIIFSLTSCFAASVETEVEGIPLKVEIGK